MPPETATDEPTVIDSLTGAELRRLRRVAGYTQVAMAARIGCGRHAISYWECSPKITLRQLRSGVPARMGKFLGFKAPPYGWQLPDNPTSMRARGDGVLVWPPLSAYQVAWIEGELARQEAKARVNVAKHRQLCQARTRKGLPCRNKSEPGRRRCKFHGGKSTGPKTAEGRARIAEAQRKRWAAYREQKRGEASRP